MESESVLAFVNESHLLVEDIEIPSQEIAEFLVREIYFRHGAALMLLDKDTVEQLFLALLHQQAFLDQMAVVLFQSFDESIVRCVGYFVFDLNPIDHDLWFGFRFGSQQSINAFLDRDGFIAEVRHNHLILALLVRLGSCEIIERLAEMVFFKVQCGDHGLDGIVSQFVFIQQHHVLLAFLDEKKQLAGSFSL